MKPKLLSLRNRLDTWGLSPVPFSVILFLLLLFLALSYFVSDPVRAAKIDRSILYYIDDLFRYSMVKTSLRHPLIFLNPYLKLLYAVIATLFYRLIPGGIISLRIMNSLFSAGVLLLLYKLTQRLGFRGSFSILAILATATFPIYFLASISALSEIIFCFFLLLSLYLLYAKRYLLSAITISLLPTLRQEGLFFLAIWAFFLLKEHRLRYLPLLFIPSFIWVMLNYLLLGHPLVYTFFYIVTMPGGGIPSTSRLLLSQVTLSSTLGYYFFLILSLTGLWIKFKDRRYFPILICLLVHIAFLLGANILLFLSSGSLARDYRYMVSLVPLLAIYAAGPVQRMAGRFMEKRKGLIAASLIFIVIILALSSLYQIGELQNHPQVIEDTLTPAQERTLKEVSIWLNEYMEKEGIRNLYVPGAETTHKVLRRLWMYLFPEIDYYPIDGDHLLAFDMVTFRIIPEHRVEGVMVTLVREPPIGEPFTSQAYLEDLFAVATSDINETNPKVVYYDTKYPPDWIFSIRAKVSKDYLVSKDFRVVNADELRKFMQVNGTGTVVVMLQSIAPDTVAHVKSPQAVIRKYLEKGGTVVWMGIDIPFYHRGHPDGTKELWGEGGMVSILGIRMGAIDIGETVIITKDGASRGLTQPWMSLGPVQPLDITKVYAQSEGGASAWLKNYNTDYPNSGFVRIWDSYTSQKKEGKLLKEFPSISLYFYLFK